MIAHELDRYICDQCGTTVDRAEAEFVVGYRESPDGGWPLIVHHLCEAHRQELERFLTAAQPWAADA